MALLSNEKYSLFYQKVRLVYQRPEIKASLEVILSVFTVTLLIFAAIRPTLTNVASLQKKVEDLEVVNKKADNKIAQVFAAQTDLDKFQDKLRLYDEAVPDGFRYFDMAGRIELMAQKRGLSIQTITLPGTKLFGTGKGAGDWSAKITTKNPSNIIAAEVSFVVNGSPAAVKGLLSDIENMDRLTLLSSVVLAADPGIIKGTATLKATGRIYFYFYSES